MSKAKTAEYSIQDLSQFDLDFFFFFFCFYAYKLPALAEPSPITSLSLNTL